MATCTVSGIIKDITETAISGAVISARPANPFFSTTVQIMPMNISTTSASDGTWSLSLNQSSQCIVTIEYPPNATDSKRGCTYTITVPAAGSANFSTLATEA